MCIVNIFRTGGGANMSASPVNSSVGTVMVSSIANVILFFNGCAGAGGPSGRLDFSSSIHRFVPSGFPARYDGDSAAGGFVPVPVAHLAGALGRPVWTMLAFHADWRWMTPERTDSPWYPTMRLFRQAKAGDWSNVLADVHKELYGYCAAANAKT